MNPRSLRDWPEDFVDDDNGEYMCRCHSCQQTFFGYKRRITCKTCAHPPATSISLKTLQFLIEFAANTEVSEADRLTQISSQLQHVLRRGQEPVRQYDLTYSSNGYYRARRFDSVEAAIAFAAEGEERGELEVYSTGCIRTARTGSLVLDAAKLQVYTALWLENVAANVAALRYIAPDHSNNDE